MRLVTFEPHPGNQRIGAVSSDGAVLDLNFAYAAYLRDVEEEQECSCLADARVPAEMRALFEGGDRSLNAARAAEAYALKSGPKLTGPSGESIFHAMNSVRLCAPIRPKKLFHTAGNFREHLEEVHGTPLHGELPWIFFFQNVDAIIGPDEFILYPEELTRELDYELELAIVLKKRGSFFKKEEAADYIGGYVIFNDVTARDMMRQELKTGVTSFCKSIETFCPLGPCIVTSDEIPEPQNLNVEVRVNGSVRQRSNTNKIARTIPEILAHYSPMGYSPGDVISTGTVSGVGGFRDGQQPLYLKPGDTVECEIERIGILRNTVISRATRTPSPESAVKKFGSKEG